METLLVIQTLSGIGLTISAYSYGTHRAKKKYSLGALFWLMTLSGFLVLFLAVSNVLWRAL